jgi:hypothetical protein
MGRRSAPPLRSRRSNPERHLMLVDQPPKFRALSGGFFQHGTKLVGRLLVAGDVCDLKLAFDFQVVPRRQGILIPQANAILTVAVHLFRIPNGANEPNLNR